MTISSVFSDTEEEFPPLTPSGLDFPTNPVATFLSPILPLQKVPLIQLHLVRRPPHVYNKLAIAQLQSQTLLLLYQPDKSSQVASLKTITLKIHKNFLYYFICIWCSAPSVTSQSPQNLDLPLSSWTSTSPWILHYSRTQNKTTPFQSIFTTQSQTKVLYMGNSFLGKSTSRIYDSEHILTFSTIDSTTTGDHLAFLLMSLNLHAPAFLCHYQFASDPPILMGNSTAMSLPLAQSFCRLPPSVTPSHAPPLRLTALSFSLLSSRRTHLSGMQNFVKHLLDLQFFCPYVSNIKRKVYRLLTRPFNTSTNTWMQNNATEKLIKLLSFNLRMIWLDCATRFSLLLEQFPSAILLLRLPLSVHQLTPTLTLTLPLLHMHSWFSCAAEPSVRRSTRRALWDQAERNQTTLQTSTFSLQTPHGMAP